MTKRSGAWAGLACGLFACMTTVGVAQAQEGMAVKSLLGKMGIVPEDKDPIRYRERAPLALPPKSATLRPPSGQVDYASKNPQWPNDPDVVARREREAEALLPVTWSDIRRMSESNPRLSVDEIRSGRNPYAAGGVPGARGDNARDVLILSPDQMRAGVPSREEKERDARTEPTRRTLVEPPTGFRKSATGGRIEATQNAPRIDQQAIDASPLAWITNKFKSDDDE